VSFIQEKENKREEFIRKITKRKKLNCRNGRAPIFTNISSKNSKVKRTGQRKNIEDKSSTSELFNGREKTEEAITRTLKSFRRRQRISRRCQTSPRVIHGSLFAPTDVDFDETEKNLRNSEIFQNFKWNIDFFGDEA